MNVLRTLVDNYSLYNVLILKGNNIDNQFTHKNNPKIILNNDLLQIICGEFNVKEKVINVEQPIKFKRTLWVVTSNGLKILLQFKNKKRKEEI